MLDKRLVSLFLLSAFLLIPSVIFAQDDDMSSATQHTIAKVFTHPSQGESVEIENGIAELITSESGAMVSFRTDGLEDGHVYTAWWVVINNPAACSASPCPTSDILGNSDEVQTAVTWGDGIIVGEDGLMEFASFLPVGDMSEGWYEQGFTNPFGAEIHLVINDHGPLIPDMASNMINTYRGGCTDDSLPPPFPDTAKADGAAGPNTCRLVQAAVFQQADA